MTDKPSYYFIGIGGIGMSGLARYFKARGYSVAGSDLAASTITMSLKKEGILVVVGQKRSHVKTAARRWSTKPTVIYNRAIRSDNPELREARSLGLTTIPYAEALGEITKEYETIAVTGSHGKSTTTALAGLVLVAGKLDPTVLLGTNVPNFGGKNIRIGRGRYLIIEADDFGAAFLDYSPSISIITNIDREHIDFYGTFRTIKRSFLAFMARTREGGTLILNRDDAVLYSLRRNIAVVARRRRLRTVWYSAHGRDAAQLKRFMTIPGLHNLSNGSAVRMLGRLLGIHDSVVLHAIRHYHGSWRRMEWRGDSSIGIYSKVSIFDDYAHHPTEIKATLAAFRERFPRSLLICVFQPHQNKRLRALFKDFAGSFNDADIVAIAPAYVVAGRDNADPRYTSKALVAAINARRHKDARQTAVYFTSLRNVAEVVTELITQDPASFPIRRSAKDAIIVMMGAGDIFTYTDRLLKKR